MEVERLIETSNSTTMPSKLGLLKDIKLDHNNIPVPQDLTQLVRILRVIFDKDVVDVDYVTQLLKNYKSNPRDWRKYAKYDPHK